MRLMSSYTLRKRLATVARKPLGSLTQVITEAPVAALTFDDGPDPDVTPRLLKLLERHGARGTFFMVGQAAQVQQDLVRRVWAGGHAIGLHAWDHPSFPMLTSRQRYHQIRACEQVLAPYAHRLFRPPHGDQSLLSRFESFLLGYEVVGFSVDSGDWHESDASVVANTVVSALKPGDIVVFHDTLFDKGRPAGGLKLELKPWVDREAMLKAVEVVLEETRSRFRFVTVPDLMQSGLPYRAFWFKRTRVSELVT